MPTLTRTKPSFSAFFTVVFFAATLVAAFLAGAFFSSVFFGAAFASTFLVAGFFAVVFALVFSSTGFTILSITSSEILAITVLFSISGAVDFTFE
ncbi:MAG: hypothetical protein E7349_02845 [Clostridiales bacterium]|nr:hypothetical protein [Clostridiales bacterium]